mgnify:CR=1 FL=1
MEAALTLVGNGRHFASLGIREVTRQAEVVPTSFYRHFRSMDEVPAETETSRRLSRALKKRGFSFVGPTMIYAFMQATGMVNDHLVDCFRHAECRELS